MHRDYCRTTFGQGQSAGRTPRHGRSDRSFIYGYCHYVGTSHHYRPASNIASPTPLPRAGITHGSCGSRVVQQSDGPWPVRLRFQLMNHQLNPWPPPVSLVTTLRENAWPTLGFPVLHQIALDPTLAGDPGTIRRLIDEQLERALSMRESLYSAEQGRHAWQAIEVAARRGQAGYTRGELVEPGLLLLAAIWSDAELRENYRAAAYGSLGGFRGSPTCNW